jgi:hypothetical protein
MPEHTMNFALRPDPRTLAMPGESTSPRGCSLSQKPRPVRRVLQAGNLEKRG